MRKLRMGVAVLAAATLVAGVAAGCGGSSDSEASTPSNATTVVNSAPQTDSTGKTVSAPTDTAATSTGGGATTGETTTGGGTDTAEVEGDAAAGKTTFDATCQGCHPNGGQDAGVGPKLAAVGLTADKVKNQITNPVGSMPANLVSGADLDNVVAYVVSIQ